MESGNNNGIHFYKTMNLALLRVEEMSSFGHSSVSPTNTSHREARWRKYYVEEERGFVPVVTIGRKFRAKYRKWSYKTPQIKTHT